MHYKRRQSGKDKPRLGWETEGRRFLGKQRLAAEEAEVKEALSVTSSRSGDEQREPAVATLGR